MRYILVIYILVSKRELCYTDAAIYMCVQSSSQKYYHQGFIELFPEIHNIMLSVLLFLFNVCSVFY